MDESNKKLVSEVLMRSRCMVEEKTKNAVRWFAAISTTVSFCIIAALSTAVSTINNNSMIMQALPENDYGAAIWRGNGNSAYMLVAVVAFVLGAAITLVCFYMQNKNRQG